MGKCSSSRHNMGGFPLLTADTDFSSHPSLESFMSPQTTPASTALLLRSILPWKIPDFQGSRAEQPTLPC